MRLLAAAVNRPFALFAYADVMFWKIAFGALAVLAILWAAGFDFRNAKDTLVGAAQDNAESLTGTSEQSDWAD